MVPKGTLCALLLLVQVLALAELPQFEFEMSFPHVG